MPELVYECRGNVVENVHCGRIAVVNRQGNLLCKLGDVNGLTYFRSASKPLQILPVLRHKLDEKYGLEDGEIAIMSASHVGQEIHLKTILSILKKTGYKEEDFIMQPCFPTSEAVRDEMIRLGLPKRKALHNCAGKHLGAMMLQEMLTKNTKDYWRQESPAQKLIAQYISEISQWPLNKLEIGVDGCGAPVFAVPLKNIAMSYMHLACPDTIEDEEISLSVKKLTPCINKNNVMLRGKGYLCSIINEDENIVAKSGAKGVYGIGLKKQGLGIALKVEDGTEDSWALIIAEILKQLNYDNRQTVEKLEKLSATVLINDNNMQVGTIKTVFAMQ